MNEAGILSFINADYPKYKAFLMILAGKEAEVVVRKRRKMSTAKQRKYYWGGILGILGLHIGYDPISKTDMQLLHEALKNMFLQYEDNKTGLTLTHSTETLTTIERNDYHKKIINWAVGFHGIDEEKFNPDNWDSEEKFFKNNSEKFRP